MYLFSDAVRIRRAKARGRGTYFIVHSHSTQRGTYLCILNVAMFHSPQSPQGCQNDVFFFTFTSKIIDVRNTAIIKNQKRPHRAQSGTYLQITYTVTLFMGNINSGNPVIFTGYRKILIWITWLLQVSKWFTGNPCNHFGGKHLQCIGGVQENDHRMHIDFLS